MKTKSTHVLNISFENGEEFEIRRLESGALVGFDGSYLEQLAGLNYEENPNNPYAKGKVIIPSDEKGPPKSVHLDLNMLSLGAK